MRKRLKRVKRDDFQGSTTNRILEGRGELTRKKGWSGKNQAGFFQYAAHVTRRNSNTDLEKNPETKRDWRKSTDRNIMQGRRNRPHLKK